MMRGPAFSMRKWTSRSSPTRTRRPGCRFSPRPARQTASRPRSACRARSSCSSLRRRNPCSRVRQLDRVVRGVLPVRIRAARGLWAVAGALVSRMEDLGSTTNIGTTAGHAAVLRRHLRAQAGTITTALFLHPVLGARRDAAPAHERQEQRQGGVERELAALGEFYELIAAVLLSLTHP